jgi:ATP-dependent Clp protease ATP-binding subunit ClpA
MVLELSLREALDLGHNYIGTEHMALGLIREGEGVAAQVLAVRGVNVDDLRRAVLDLIGTPADERPGSARPGPPEWAPTEPVTIMVEDRLRAIEVVLELMVERLDAIERRLPPQGEAEAHG